MPWSNYSPNQRITHQVRLSRISCYPAGPKKPPTSEESIGIAQILCGETNSSEQELGSGLALPSLLKRSQYETRRHPRTADVSSPGHKMRAVQQLPEVASDGRQVFRLRPWYQIPRIQQLSG